MKHAKHTGVIAICALVVFAALSGCASSKKKINSEARIAGAVAREITEDALASESEINAALETGEVGPAAEPFLVISEGAPSEDRSELEEDRSSSRRDPRGTDRSRGQDPSVAPSSEDVGLRSSDRSSNRRPLVYRGLADYSQDSLEFWEIDSETGSPTRRTRRTDDPSGRAGRSGEASAVEGRSFGTGAPAVEEGSRLQSGSEERALTVEGSTNRGTVEKSRMSGMLFVVVIVALAFFPIGLFACGILIGITFGSRIKGEASDWIETWYPESGVVVPPPSGSVPPASG